VNAGKRVRAETAISKGTCSISSAAAEFCLTQLGRDTGIYNSLRDARVSIIGAGKMTRLLLINLKAKGVKRVTIVNRSLASIEKLREQFPELQIEMRLMDDLYRVVADSEVVFTSTSSEVPIILPEELRAALATREASAGGVQLIDISVPRNVHADCDSASTEAHPVKCYNVDDLNAVVAKNTARRRKEIVQAESILREELKTFTHWQQSQGAVPTIVKLKQKAETMRLQTLEIFAKKLHDLNPKDKRTVENLTHTLINKFVTGPVTHLQKTGGDDNRVAAKHLHEAFEL
jgi:glutamyl-tRNA reductase